MKTLSHLLKIGFSLAFALYSTVVHGAEYVAKEGCYAALVNECEILNTTYKNSLATSYAPNASLARGAAISGAGLNSAGTSAQTAAALCASLSSKCVEACRDVAEQQTCSAKIAAASARMKAEGTGFSISGSEMTMIAGLLSASAGVGATLLSKSGNSSSGAYQQTQSTPAQATGALQLDGSLQCQYADSYKYADCNTYLVSACTSTSTTTAAASQTPVTGTVIQSPSGASTQVNCTAFTERYCSSTSTAQTGMGYHLPSGVVMQVNMAGSGEGYATAFCQKAWCDSDGTNATCPLCQQLSSATCQSDPATCLQGSTSTAASCQGFPQVAAGTTSVNGEAVVSQVPTVPTDGTSSVATGQITPASLSSELIAPGGVLVRRDPASTLPVAGPTSDIMGAYGPSIFSTSSQVMVNRCQVGQLNCP